MLFQGPKGSKGDLGEPGIPGEKGGIGLPGLPVSLFKIVFDSNISHFCFSIFFSKTIIYLVLCKKIYIKEVQQWKMGRKEW